VKGRVKVEMTTGLILVDVQNDFIDGSLAVNSANSIISTINYLLLHHQFKLIIASQDYHPKDHISFASTHQGSNQFTTILIEQNGNQGNFHILSIINQ
jgi:nicotinamidase/pyrazinamidase